MVVGQKDKQDFVCDPALGFGVKLVWLIYPAITVIFYTVAASEVKTNFIT